MTEPLNFTDRLLDDIDAIYEAAIPYVKTAQQLTDRSPDVAGVWFDYSEPMFVLDCGSASPYQMKLAGIDTRQRAFDGSRPEGTFVGLVLTRRFGKYASITDDIKGVLRWNDRYYSPSPAAATIATGLLGAGLGYGGTALLAPLLPRSWDKSKLRRLGLVGGGLLGALPGLVEMGKSVLVGQSVWDGDYLTEEAVRRRKEAKRPSDYGIPILERTVPVDKLPAERRQKMQAEKNAAYTPVRQGYSEPYSYGLPQVDSEQLLRTIWTHPGASQLKPSELAVFTGAVAGASRISGSPYPTVNDFARLTAGMGVGYAGGYAAGRVLGTLTGLPVSAQNTLANTGAYFGAVKATLPLLFGAGIQ